MRKRTGNPYFRGHPDSTQTKNAKRRFNKIKQVADSVDITNMNRAEADRERFYAVIGAQIVGRDKDICYNYEND